MILTLLLIWAEPLVQFIHGKDWKREIKKENCLHLICVLNAKKAKEKLLISPNHAPCKLWMTPSMRLQKKKKHKAPALEILTLSSKSTMSQRDLKKTEINNQTNQLKQ